MEIKAIPTRYKGYHFRSRLEARWAVYFDACEIDWVYEPQGYELACGERYLPDFKLEDGNIFVEIKPKRDLVAFAKALRFISEAPQSWKLFCIGGEPDYCSHPYFEGGNVAEVGPDVLINNCSKYGPFYWCSGYDYWVNIAPDEQFYKDLPVNVARSARFEHGECGPT